MFLVSSRTAILSTPRMTSLIWLPKEGMSLRIAVTEDREVTVNRESVREYIARQQDRYRKAKRTEKGMILDEVVAVTGYHRKSAGRLLSGRSRGVRGGQVGKPVEYGTEVAAAARVVHEAAGGIGAKRLHPFVGELASRLAAFGELEMGPETEALLGRASASTLERLLAEAQAPMRRKARSLTKSGTMLRNRIEVRTFRGWDDARPGFVEVDTVAHCGATTEGVPPVDSDGGGRGHGVGGDGRCVGQDAGASGGSDTEDA